MMHDTSLLFKALADRNRLRILKMLQVRPLCVCEIREILDLAASTVSQHLAILRRAGFVYDIKDNKWVIYHLNRQSRDAAVRALLATLGRQSFDDDIYHADAERARVVDRHELCGL